MNNALKRRLMILARQSIEEGLATGTPFMPDLTREDPSLCEPGACFVTLSLDGELRGCIGSLEARRPLAQDVTQNAYAAAFRDPRFLPLQAGEFEGLHLHISLLNRPERFPVADQDELIARIRPGIDGLILEDGHHRATFLPSVWDSLPSPRDFVLQLKRKAGMPLQYWSPTLQVYRYTVDDIEEAEVLPPQKPEAVGGDAAQGYSSNRHR